MNEIVSSDIKRMLEEQEESSKKQIAISLDEKAITELDKIAKRFSQINKKKSFSRNFLIEMAVNSFIKESYNVLDEYDVPAEDDLSENEEETENDVAENDFNLVIHSSREVQGGFADTFLGEHKWYPLRIKADKRPKVKYIAIYRGTPMSCITHYAEIERIEFDPEVGEDVAFLKGEPIELPHKITLGSKQGYHFRAPRYLTLDRLLNAKTADDLF